MTLTAITINLDSVKFELYTGVASEPTRAEKNTQMKGTVGSQKQYFSFLANEFDKIII